MHIVVLCATNRGFRFIERLFDIGYEHRFTVFSFREEPWEPPYFEDIAEIAKRFNAEFYEARNVGDEKWRDFWESTKVDVIFMVNWRYLVMPRIYQRAEVGAYVFHDSLLPKYRGFSPTLWAIRNGERETGVTLFEATEEIDAGDILSQHKVTISSTDTIADVLEKVTNTYLDIITVSFDGIVSGTLKAVSQVNRNATYTCKWIPSDFCIDWTQSSASIFNLIRATTKPYPGAFCYLDNKKLTVWSAEIQSVNKQYVARVSGRVVEVNKGIGTVIATGDGTLLLREVQIEGEPVVNASDLLNSYSQTLTSQPRHRINAGTNRI